MHAYTIIAAVLLTLLPTLGFAQTYEPTPTMSPELRQALHERAEAQREASLKLAALQAAHVQTLAVQLQKQVVVPPPRMTVAELRRSCVLFPDQAWLKELLRAPQENPSKTTQGLAGSAGGRAAANLIK